MKYLLAIIAVEALTQLICKAEIFDTPREWLSRCSFFERLLSCGYCVSVWSALFVIVLLMFWNYTQWFILLLVLHRISNVLHDVYGVLLQAKINLILRRK